MKKHKKGGARKGAGRKPAGTVRMEIWVKPDTRNWLKSQDRKPGQIIDKLAGN
jgi:hypothetical protein